MGISGDIPGRFPFDGDAAPFDEPMPIDLVQMGTVQVDRLMEDADPFSTFDFVVPRQGAMVVVNVLIMRDGEGKPTQDVASVGRMQSINETDPDLFLVSAMPHKGDGMIFPEHSIMWRRGAHNFIGPEEPWARMGSHKRNLTVGGAIIPLLVHSEPFNIPGLRVVEGDALKNPGNRRSGI